MDDSIKLLKECDTGTKIAVSAINDILDKVNNKKLKEIIIKSRDAHCELGNDIHHLLTQSREQAKEPNTMVKSMSWFKSNVKMMLDNSDQSIANLLIDGCNMGIKSLYKYLNQYPKVYMDMKICI